MNPFAIRFQSALKILPNLDTDEGSLSAIAYNPPHKWLFMLLCFLIQFSFLLIVFKYLPVNCPAYFIIDDAQIVFQTDYGFFLHKRTNGVLACTD